VARLALRWKASSHELSKYQCHAADLRDRLARALLRLRFCLPLFFAKSKSKGVAPVASCVVVLCVAHFSCNPPSSSFTSLFIGRQVAWRLYLSCTYPALFDCLCFFIKQIFALTLSLLCLSLFAHRSAALYRSGALFFYFIANQTALRTCDVVWGKRNRVLANVKRDRHGEVRAPENPVKATIKLFTVQWQTAMSRLASSSVMVVNYSNLLPLFNTILRAVSYYGGRLRPADNIVMLRASFTDFLMFV